MIGAVGVFVILLLWRFLVLWAAAVFEAVGLSPPSARFEARSALTGAGYTTSQSEQIAQHPAARRAASTMMVVGYFGPAAILALLGASFLLPPAGEGLRAQAITVTVLCASLFALDRSGAIRAFGSRPATALARRTIGANAFDTWTLIGDQAMAILTIPDDQTLASRTLAVVDAAEVTLLAVTPAGEHHTFYLAGGLLRERPGPGDRIVVFGPRQQLEPLRASLV
jgi:hypothetical protein